MKQLHTKKDNIIWYVSPKTGSRSMHQYFLDQNFAFPPEKLAVVKDLDSCIFSFSFSRNPWDKIVSVWRDKVEKQWSEDYPYPQFRIPYFQQFSGKDFIFFVKNMMSNKNLHLEPQSKLCDLHLIDFIGRFENLQQDFDIVCEKVGIPQQQLAHKNSSNWTYKSKNIKTKHYTEYYDDETRQIVAKKYAKDIEYFGYKFGE